MDDDVISRLAVFTDYVSILFTFITYRTTICQTGHEKIKTWVVLRKIVLHNWGNFPPPIAHVEDIIHPVVLDVESRKINWRFHFRLHPHFPVYWKWVGWVEGCNLGKSSDNPAIISEYCQDQTIQSWPTAFRKSIIDLPWTPLWWNEFRGTGICRWGEVSKTKQSPLRSLNLIEWERRSVSRDIPWGSA